MIRRTLSQELRAVTRRGRRWRRHSQLLATYSSNVQESGQVERFVDLSPAQWELFADPKRFRIVFAGRRSGKTVWAIVEAIIACLEKPNARVYYVGPTYQMVRDVAWELATRLIPESYLRKAPNETRLQFSFRNGSVLALRSAEKPLRLKGVGLDLVVLDEFVQMRPEVWAEALRPTLMSTGGRAIFVSTPQGFNWGYDLWESALQPENADLWGCHELTTLEAGWISAAEIEQARREMDPRTFEQELEARFRSMKGRVFSNFERRIHVPMEDGQPVVVDPALAVRRLNVARAQRGAPPIPVPDLYVGMDFNVHPMAVVLGVRRGRRHLDVIDAWEVPTSNTEEVAQMLKDKHPDRRIIVCPDPYSSNARHTNAPAGETDLTILRRHGFEISLPDPVPRVVDRINSVQALLRNAAGESHVRFHPAAAHLIRACEVWTYKDKTSAPDKKSRHSHIADAFQYLVSQEFNLLAHHSWLVAPHHI